MLSTHGALPKDSFFSLGNLQAAIKPRYSQLHWHPSSTMNGIAAIKRAHYGMLIPPATGTIAKRALRTQQNRW
jgi:hypothetical protein